MIKIQLPDYIAYCLIRELMHFFLDNPFSCTGQQNMGDIIHAIALVISGVACIACASMLYRILAGNKTGYDTNRKRVGKFLNNLCGKVPPVSDGTRDSRVSAGVAIDVRRNEWVEQGKLTREAVTAVLRRHQ
jgi:hypothetical protein